MNNSDFDCKGYLFFRIFIDHTYYLFNYPPLVSSFLCTIVFMRIVMNSTSDNNKGQMFNYFLVKSIVELLIFISVSTPEKYYDGNDKDYLWQLWFVYISWYFFYICISISNLMEIFAIIDCYLMITNKLKFLITKKCFYFLIVSSVLFNIIINSHYIRTKKILVNEAENGSNILSYKTIESKQDYDLVIDLALLVYREVLPLVFLLIFNCLILKFLRTVAMRKRTIQANISNSPASQQAELNKIKLILCTSFSFIIMRTPFAINEIYSNGNNIFWKCYFYSLTYRLYEASFFIPIFNYYFFNKKFRKYLHLTITLKRTSH
jgi:hypothetical protein